MGGLTDREEAMLELNVLKIAIILNNPNGGNDAKNIVNAINIALEDMESMQNISSFIQSFGGEE